MATDDSAMYTGVDSETIGGVFGNEIKNPEIEKIEQEQERLIKELTPKLKDILKMIENERKDVLEAIAEFTDNSLESEEVNTSEVKAAARYRKYLSLLKTKFALALGEARGSHDD